MQGAAPQEVAFESYLKVELGEGVCSKEAAEVEAAPQPLEVEEEVAEEAEEGGRSLKLSQDY